MKALTSTQMSHRISSSSLPGLIPTLSLSGRGKGEGSVIIAVFIAALMFSPRLGLSASLDEMLAKRKPEATIDLAKKEGVQLVKGEWRYSDTKIVEVDFKSAGPDGQPGNSANKAYDF